MEIWERSSRRQPPKCGDKWTGSRERSRHGVLNFTHPFIYLEEINCCCQPTFGGGERIQEFPAYPLLVKESQVWVPQQDWVWSCKMHSSVCEQIFPILNRPCRAAHSAAFWALVSLVTGYLGDFFPASEKERTNVNWNKWVFMGRCGSDESWKPAHICKAVRERRVFWARDGETGGIRTKTICSEKNN